MAEVYKSDYVQYEFRTKPKPGADDIKGDVRIVGHESKKVTKAGTGNNGGKLANDTETVVTEVYVTWTPPKDPNLLIVRYNIEILSADDTDEPLTDCVTSKEFEEN